MATPRCPRCSGLVIDNYGDVLCINCGCRPLFLHMANQHEPDGLKPWRGPGDVVLITREAA